jgi:poly-gamma-glutamate capsule biosynthesis protein CapA/YwtB (metallophosphatase superfamily)
MSMREWPAGLSRRLLVAAVVSVILLVNLPPVPARTVSEAPPYPSLSFASSARPAVPVPSFSPSLVGPPAFQGAGPAATGGPPTARAQPRQLTLVAAGDVLVHLSVAEQARADARRTGRSGYDFLPMFQHVAPRISRADLALCHLEVPLAEPGGPFTGYPLFNAPPQLADGIRRAGYDGCSVASNHTLDQGERGVVRTIRELEAAGLGHTGSARNPREAATPRIYDRSGVRVAHLSYTMNFNGLRRPPGKEWLANQIEPAKIRAAAKRARAAGAEIVVLSLHWGTEYRNAPDADQQRWASQLIASPDIDLIVGHHAHVVQPFRRYGDKWVVFGMGNHLARQRTAGTQDGVMARVTFTETASGQWRTSRIEAIPTRIDFAPAIRLIDLPAALASPALPTDRRRNYQAAYDRVRREVSASGAVRSGLVVVPPGR